VFHPCQRVSDSLFRAFARKYLLTFRDAIEALGSECGLV
jgi:hypothetical protein